MGNDIVSSLFPNIPTLIGHIIASVIILSLFGFLIYKPLRKFLSDRNSYIQKNITASETVRTSSVLDRQKAAQELETARGTRSVIIQNAKTDANKISDEIIQKANHEAARLKEDAFQMISIEKKNYQDNAHKEIVSVAMLAAQKIIEKELKENSFKKIVNDFLAE